MKLKQYIVERVQSSSYSKPQSPFLDYRRNNLSHLQAASITRNGDLLIRGHIPRIAEASCCTSRAAILFAKQDEKRFQKATDPNRIV